MSKTNGTAQLLGTRIATPSTMLRGPTASEDFAIVRDLLEDIDRNPASIEARKLLAQQYRTFGWDEAAADAMREVLDIAPADIDANAWLKTEVKTKQPKAKPRQVCTHGNYARVSESTTALFTVEQLGSSYETLLANAKDLLQELIALQSMHPDPTLVGQISDLKALSEGKFTSVVKARPPLAARSAAANIKTSEIPLEAAFHDLETNYRWTRKQTSSDSSDDADQVRDAVRKRADAIKDALPKAMIDIVETAFTHAEHEFLGREYQNGTETMLGDDIANIPRDRFWASEDGYAWDMDELAAAIKSNSGVMRNPLSKQIFSQADVRAIVHHTCGQSLAALQLEQEHLTRGVRTETVKRLDKLSEDLLNDDSADAFPSRKAVEEYLTYVATLPDAEQNTLDKLRVPATDSHTGQNFDVTIGQAVEDAKANRQCFHKTGDHLRQAAKYLRANSTREAKMPGAWD